MNTQAESTAPAEATEVDSEVVSTPGEDSAPSGTEAAASGDDRSNWTEKAQKRYDELTEARYKEAARADREAYRREQLEREIEQLRQPAKPQTVAPSDEYPTLESVGWDEAKHATAVATWSAKQATAAAKAELAAERDAKQRAELDATWSRREAEFVKSKPDYSEKVLRPPALGGPAITEAMAQVIRESDIGPEVAYYLGENVAKSVEIARLPPHLQAREIGRIEAKLEAAKASAPPVSKAPPPAAKIDAGGSDAPLDLGSEESNTLSADEWNRRMELKERRKRTR